jgi:hypothetical protein
MHVVGHQDIGVQPAVIPVGGLPEIIEITVIVAVTIEARLTIVATLDNMLGNAGKIETRLSCQGPPPCGKACRCGDRGKLY